MLYTFAILFSTLITSPVFASQTLELSEEIKQNIRLRVDYGYNTSIIVGIITPDGTKYYSYGKTSLTGNQTPNENTIFEIGSVTKVFTTLILADMLESGQLSLNDPIDKHLPPDVNTPKRNGQSITILHLATHTSSLPRMPNNTNRANWINPLADYTPEKLYDCLSKIELKRDIGAKYEYSNLGVGLLGHILELKTGSTFEELIKNRITNELGMPDTVITLTPAMTKHLAKGHMGKSEVDGLILPVLTGAGAIRSTAKDMLTFLAANMGLKKTPLYSAMQAAHKPLRQRNSKNRKIGLAWNITTTAENQYLWHAGGTRGHGSFIGFDKDRQIGVVLLSNSNTPAMDIGLHVLDPARKLKTIKPKPPKKPGQSGWRRNKKPKTNTETETTKPTK